MCVTNYALEALFLNHLNTGLVLLAFFGSYYISCCLLVCIYTNPAISNNLKLVMSSVSIVLAYQYNDHVLYIVYVAVFTYTADCE